MKKCTSFEEQKDTRHIRENVYFSIIIFSCLSSTKWCLRFLSNCFVLEIKGFYQSSLGNEVGFRVIMNVSPNILSKNFKKLKFQKTETQFYRWKSTENNDINIFLSLKNPCTFLLAKKRPENTFLTKIVNYSKIVEKTNHAIQNNSKLTI